MAIGGLTGGMTLPSTNPTGWTPQYQQSIVPGYTGPVATPQQVAASSYNAAGTAPGSGSTLASMVTGQNAPAPAAPVANANQNPAPTQGTQPATTVQNGVSQQYQPFTAQQTQEQTNLANANTQSSGFQQQADLRNSMAARGMGGGSPAELGQRANIMGDTRNQVAQNNLSTPFQNAQFNATFGLGQGQLQALQNYNLGNEALGRYRTGNELINAILNFTQF